MLRSRLARLFSTAGPRRAPARPSPLARARESLRTRYPHLDPASLVTSFLVLHELTAIVPLFLGFYALKTLGVGEQIVHAVAVDDTAPGERGWWQGKMAGWVQEGDKQAEAIGRRYGAFGFEKETREQREARKSLAVTEMDAGAAVPGGTAARLGGDVANLVAAYLLVKVGPPSSFRLLADTAQISLPLRVLASIRMAPSFANAVVGRIKRVRNRYRKRTPTTPPAA